MTQDDQADLEQGQADSDEHESSDDDSAPMINEAVDRRMETLSDLLTSCLTAFFCPRRLSHNTANSDSASYDCYDCGQAIGSFLRELRF